ncbi:GerAB/ArcD/ProY family transporter [Paenibacillus alkalitolerans]|uniref:GerAB/ArcD/ProY family transporter n=1 Tax=Paenibacillus alkalitolerans TaxID=2799335 RepID=UPI0018F310D8|nr:endospore germination permease [Paenibacillus alkalitolerans]
MNRQSQHKPVISPRQSSSLVSSTIIGVGVLTLPRATTEYAKQSGWLSVVLGAICAMVAVAVITSLARRFPGKSIVAFSAEILSLGRNKTAGRVISFPFLLLYFAYWGFTTVIVARIFGEVVITTVLTETPLEVIITTMLLTSLVLIFQDVEVLARVNEILLPIIVIPVLIIALSSYQSAKLYNLFPMREGVDWMSFLTGIMYTSFSYLGFEVLTLFLAHTHSDRKLLRLNLLGIAIPGLVYTLIAFSGIAVFGVDELRLLAWPTLELVKVTEVPGLILERLESAFLGVWVAAVFTTTANLYYSSCLIIKQMLGFKGHRIIALVLFPAYYYISLLPQNIHSLFEYQTHLSFVGAIIALIIPLILLIVAVIRRKGDPYNPLETESGSGGKGETS